MTGERIEREQKITELQERYDSVAGHRAPPFSPKGPITARELEQFKMDLQKRLELVENSLPTARIARAADAESRLSKFSRLTTLKRKSSNKKKPVSKPLKRKQTPISPRTHKEIFKDKEANETIANLLQETNE